MSRAMLCRRDASNTSFAQDDSKGKRNLLLHSVVSRKEKQIHKKVCRQFLTSVIRIELLSILCWFCSLIVAVDASYTYEITIVSFLVCYSHLETSVLQVHLNVKESTFLYSIKLTLVAFGTIVIKFAKTKCRPCSSRPSLRLRL